MGETVNLGREFDTGTALPVAKTERLRLGTTQTARGGGSMSGVDAIPRHWVRACEVPPDVTVTAPIYSSDSRMRWRRIDSGLFAESYPGCDDIYVTAEGMDARVGAAGYDEVRP